MKISTNNFLGSGQKRLKNYSRGRERKRKGAWPTTRTSTATTAGPQPSPSKKFLSFSPSLSPLSPFNSFSQTPPFQGGLAFGFFVGILVIALVLGIYIPLSMDGDTDSSLSSVFWKENHKDTLLYFLIVSFW
jgi:hypothetical protein